MRMITPPPRLFSAYTTRHTNLLYKTDVHACKSAPAFRYFMTNDKTLNIDKTVCLFTRIEKKMEQSQRDLY